MDMTSPAWFDEADSPWHAGEVALQRQAGVAERMKDLGRRVVRDHMPDQHRAFFAQLPFVAVGSVDRDGDVWATLVAGKPGFMQAPTAHKLRIDARPAPRDPAAAGIHDGAAVGLLGIELHTRRRNRMNGIVSDSGATGFAVDVAQSFGNCPQYIQMRNFAFTRDPALAAHAEPVISGELSERAREMIASADTFFVASYADRTGSRREVDVSHRGGNTGFVRVGADGVLTIPDFAGNSFFATLGNILVNGRAGLVFVDFASGDLLQISGDATVDLDSPEVAAFQGAERLWRVKPRRVVYRAGALPLRWVFHENGWSLNSLMTGNWAEAENRRKAAALADTWRPFRVTQIVDESATIRSFHLEPLDGAGVLPHAAGQHLPIRVVLPDTTATGATTTPASAATRRRTYTISSGPADGAYRISVKRDGRVSRHLHDTLRVGSMLEARAPAGRFTLDAHEQRPAVLLAAGVGITPMIAMLRHIVYEGLRTRHMRPTWLFQSARTLRERAFNDEIDYLASVSGGVVEVVRTLSDPQRALKGKDFDHAGRIDIALLRETLPLDDYDFYLCGPAGFMQSLYDGLRKLNIDDARIHAEAFGPSGVTRTRDAKAAGIASAAAVPHTPATASTPVVFAKSGKEARWEPARGTLLEFAEAQGLAPEFSCRGGSCGSCRTRIVDGAVAYSNPPEYPVAEHEALLCCAVPASPEAAGAAPLVLDL
ncbi:Flavohemoprotein [Paraburkholderia humisilvae]|uniref:Flavohemoprotein n=3 Tax=Paraburkholderia humisilvae TaxID=627669 RepID=A0A6J5EZM0_9BURK|nr:Flavohemoprotein [Paraburkholderia humisilvae]